MSSRLPLPPSLPRDQETPSEQTEVKKAASSQSPGSQPTTKARPHYEVHEGTRFQMMIRSEGRDPHPTDGNRPSDPPSPVRRQPNASRIPRPLGQVFIDPPELGIGDDINTKDQVPAVLRPGFSTDTPEICEAVRVRLRRVNNADIIKQDVRARHVVATSVIGERYGPVLQISPSAEHFLGPNEGDQMPSLPQTPARSHASRSRILLKHLPAFSPFVPAKLLDEPANVGSLVQGHPSSETRVIQTNVVKAALSRKTGVMKKTRSMFFPRSKPEPRGERFRIASTSMAKPALHSTPELANLATRPVAARPSVPEPAQVVILKPELPATAEVAEILPSPLELVLHSTPELAQSAIVVLAETVPTRPASLSTATNQPPANTAVIAATRYPTSLSPAELTQCVNRLGKRLVEENDPDQRKKLYKDFVRLMSLRADMESWVDLSAEAESLLSVMRAESARRHIMMSLRALAIYQEDGSLLNDNVPADRIETEW